MKEYVLILQATRTERERESIEHGAIVGFVSLIVFDGAHQFSRARALFRCVFVISLWLLSRPFRAASVDWPGRAVLFFCAL